MLSACSRLYDDESEDNIEHGLIESLNSCENNPYFFIYMCKKVEGLTLMVTLGVRHLK